MFADVPVSPQLATALISAARTEHDKSMAEAVVLLGMQILARMLVRLRLNGPRNICVLAHLCLSHASTIVH